MRIIKKCIYKTRDLAKAEKSPKRVRTPTKNEQTLTARQDYSSHTPGHLLDRFPLSPCPWHDFHGLAPVPWLADVFCGNDSRHISNLNQSLGPEIKKYVIEM